MADEAVYMDTPYVEGLVKQFKGLSQTCQNIVRILDGIKMMLKTLWFLGGIGAAAEQMLNSIQKMVRQFGENMNTLSGDVDGALKSFRDGDNSGSNRFR